MIALLRIHAEEYAYDGTEATRHRQAVDCCVGIVSQREVYA